MSQSVSIDAAQIRAEAEQLLSSTTDAADVDRVKQWPVLSPAALYGIAGEIVNTLGPHTEADPAALLIQFLAAFGSVIGRTAHFRVGADLHHTKLFAVVVGDTSAGRKGTSWSEIERIMLRVDPSFQKAIQNGLSSGEGLIYHVRDPSPAKGKRAGKANAVDLGADEKRAFVIEPEFVRVLKVIQRETNTLSSVIRQSWDTDRLSVLTKDPLRATGAHITIVGHITETELKRKLQETEYANGFANRFLWVCVRRSKYLPDGGTLTDVDLDTLVDQVKRAVKHAVSMSELPRDLNAAELWRKVYRPLSDGFDGLLGSVTSRATAQVMRLATVYALLDRARNIQRDHLEAALAAWQYCEDSARYIFDAEIGDTVATRLLSALSSKYPEWLPTTDLHAALGRNYKAAIITSALQSLVRAGRAEEQRMKTGHAGRPTNQYRAVHPNEINELLATKSAT